jgi:hypothetical protein
MTRLFDNQKGSWNHWCFIMEIIGFINICKEYMKMGWWYRRCLSRMGSCEKKIELKDYSWKSKSDRLINFMMIGYPFSFNACDDS